MSEPTDIETVRRVLTSDIPPLDLAGQAAARTDHHRPAKRMGFS